MPSKWQVGFIVGSNYHTSNPNSFAWVIYAPSRHLVTSTGAYIGPKTNNMDEYIVVIEFLWDSTLNGITHLEVMIDSQSVVSQLNDDYQV